LTSIAENKRKIKEHLDKIKNE